VRVNPQPAEPISGVPDDRHYTQEHVWVLRTSDDMVRLGVTDFAQSKLGALQVAAVSPVGTKLPGEFATLATDKVDFSVSAPLDGRILATNDALNDTPQLINSDPYTDGWMIDLQCDQDRLATQIASLLDSVGYRKRIQDRQL
jgi:glycine cleavage system H protein